MFDFDKDFEEYVIKWFEAHRDEGMCEHELEDKMPELYETWANLPNSSLSGLSPYTFFANIDAPDLVKLMVTGCDGDKNPSTLLLDRIVEKPECAEGLRGIIRTSKNNKARIIAANLLTEMGEDHPLDVYAALVCDDTADEGLRELGIEVMCDHADEVADALYKLIPSATRAQKGMIAEVLANAKADDRTLRLLEEMFAHGDNLAFFASLIGKYGDERAAAMLYRALDTCCYADYIEIKNAIERLGGVVDDSRDFTDDPTYRIIKNLG